MTHTAEVGEMRKLFDDLTADRLRERGTAKWSVYGRDVLAAWVAEMDFPNAPPITRALAAAIENDRTGYPTRPEDSGLPQACTAWLSRNHSVSVDPERIIILPDILRGIELAIEAAAQPDSAIVVMTPSYPPFFETVRVAGHPIAEVPLLVDAGRFTFDLAGIEAALREGAGTVILCNPFNPVGRVFTRDELTGLAEVVDRYGARVIADEVHAPLVYPGAEHVSYSTISAAAREHSVTLTSASKAWNVAGLKCAVAVLTAETDLPVWQNMSMLKTHGASILGILANRVAFEEGEPWLREVVTYLHGNRTLLTDLLAERLPRVGFEPPQGTYLAWLDCRPLGIEDPTSFFLEEAKVALTGGVSFGAPAQGYVRLNFATSRDILTQIVDRMAAAVEQAGY
jgi:cysteine-S-conjugate beta-lyase